jgi:hypothetical protein
MRPLAALGAIDDLAFRSGRDPSDDTAIGGCARRSSGTAGAPSQVAAANTPPISNAPVTRSPLGRA